MCIRNKEKFAAGRRAAVGGTPSSIREPILEMRRPAFLVLSSPHLHGLRVVLDLSIFGVEPQLAVYLPRDVGKLKHRDSDVSYGDGSVELFSLADSRDKVGEMHIGHRIAAGKVRR